MPHYSPLFREKIWKPIARRTLLEVSNNIKIQLINPVLERPASTGASQGNFSSQRWRQIDAFLVQF